MKDNLIQYAEHLLGQPLQPWQREFLGRVGSVGLERARQYTDESGLQRHRELFERLVFGFGESRQ